MARSDDMSIGVDIGTTYCRIACLDEAGDPQIQKNADGEKETPSVICISPSGERIVGSAAKEMLAEAPERVLMNAKGLFCTGRLISAEGVRYSPKDLYRTTLSHMVRDFCRTRGMQTEEPPFIGRAVLTVPAHFGHADREAVLAAARAAGIARPEILEEPTAAAIAYGYGHADGGHKRILVFDLGGGTIEITVLEIDGRMFSSIGVASGDDIGGLRFDAILKRIATRRIAERSGSDPEIVESNTAIQSELDLRAEEMKKRLSTSETASGCVAMNGRRVSFEVTRKEFEDAAGYLVDSALDYVDRALAEACAEADGLDAFVLTGGSTRMPMVADAVRERYPGAAVVISDPAFAVAKGAAIYAGRDASDVKVNLVLSKTYGIKVRVDDREVVSNMLYRGMRLPYEFGRTFHPEAKGQRMVSMEIYENSACAGAHHSELGDSRFVGRVSAPLPDRCTLDTRLSIRMIALPDGRLSVRVESGGMSTMCDIGTSAETAPPLAEETEPIVTDPDPSAPAR